MQRLSTLGFLALLTLGVTGTAEAKEKIVILVGEDSDANDASIPIAGEVSRLLDYLATETDAEFEIQRYQWKRALLLAQAGKGILYGASITPERKKTLKFSEAFYSEQVWVVTRCDQQFNFHTVADLKAKTIGLIRESTYGEELDLAKEQLFKPEFDMNNSRARFQKLLKRRLDAVLSYSRLKEAYQLEVEINNLYGQLAYAEAEPLKKRPFCVLPHAAAQVSLHFAQAPGVYESYLKRLDAALIKARDSGKLTNLNQSARP